MTIPMLINKPFFDVPLNTKDYMTEIKKIYRTPNPVPEKFIPVFDTAMHRFNMKILKSIDNGGRRKEKRNTDRRKNER